MPVKKSSNFNHLFSLIALLNCSVFAYDFTAVNKLIDDSIKVFRGPVLVMVEKDGQTIFDTSRGKIDTLTRMRIASASKWISGAVILRCVELGYFSLDDTLGKYLPIFTENGKGAISIRQCFTMTSGLYGGQKYESEVLYTLEESADSIAKYTPVAFTPGTAWAYDGKGMQAAGRFAEVATGKSWRELAREFILQPCGMDSTDYDYYKSNPWLAGGIKTTPADYMKFLRMIINNGMSKDIRVLSESSVNTMFSAPNKNKPLYAQADPVWPIGNPAYQYGMDTIRYGFSSWVFVYNPSSNIVEQIASPGFWGVAPWADRSRKLTGVIFMDGGLLGPLAYNTEISLIDLIDKAVGGSAILQKDISKKNELLCYDKITDVSVFSINGKYLGKPSDVQMNQKSSQLLIYKIKDLKLKTMFIDNLKKR